MDPHEIATLSLSFSLDPSIALVTPDYKEGIIICTCKSEQALLNATSDLKLANCLSISLP